MLKISLYHFRCWKNLVLNIPINKITLIKGRSGVGKTTIFQSISWCLYGNVRSVTPNNIDKIKTRVSIELFYTLNGVDGILTITREKNPNRLLLKHNNELYEDEVAQSIINKIFGSYDIWLSSSYINQGSRNNFLISSNVLKMDLLNSIAFHEEDPSIFIEKIDDYINKTESEYKEKLVDYNIEKENYLLVSNIDRSKVLTSDQEQKLKDKLESLINERGKLQEENIKRQTNLELLQNLQDQFNKIKNIEVPEGANLSQIDNEINEIVNLIPLLLKRDQITNKINECDNLLHLYNIDVSKVYSNDDYQNAISKEVAFNHGNKLAQDLNVPYNRESIEQKIKEYQDLLLTQKKLKLEKRIETLEKEYFEIQSVVIEFPNLNPNYIPSPDLSKYPIEELNQELNKLIKNRDSIQLYIQNLQERKNILKCPQCNTLLKYQDNSLTISNSDPIDTNELYIKEKELEVVKQKIEDITKEINSLTLLKNNVIDAYKKSIQLEQERIKKLKQIYRQLEIEKQKKEFIKQTINKQIIELKQELENYKTVEIKQFKILNDNEIKEINQLIARLSNIVIIEPPLVSSQKIKDHLKYQELKTKKDKLLIKYKDCLEKIPKDYHNRTVESVQKHLNKLKSYRAKIQEALQNQELRKSLQEQIIVINSKIKEDPIPRLNDINKEIENIQELLILSQKAYEAIKIYSKLIGKEKKVAELNNTLLNLQLLKKYALESECYILQQITDSINETIQSVCNSLFDNEISVTLNLFKTLKTNKITKPNVNFIVSYQGCTFDNINFMSGGEIDRISLALTLAFNKLTSSPMLLLDESLSSLDLNFKELAIKTIRENINNTVIIIMHDGIEGLFDYIINLDSMIENKY